MVQSLVPDLGGQVMPFHFVVDDEIFIADIPGLRECGDYFDELFFICGRQGMKCIEPTGRAEIEEVVYCGKYIMRHGKINRNRIVCAGL